MPISALLRINYERYEQTLNLTFTGGNSAIAQRGLHCAIAQLWGRARIKDLMNQMFGYETKDGVEAVTDTAWNYQILSQYTAFVAVSEEVRVDPEGTRQIVQVPVELPEGVSYTGIFDDVAAAGMATISAPMLFTSQADRCRGFTSVNQASLGKLSMSAPIYADSEGLEAQPIPQLEIVSAIGLDPADIASITQHLQQLNLPTGFKGEIVFEFFVSKNRVEQIVLVDILPDVNARGFPNLTI